MIQEFVNKFMESTDSVKEDLFNNPPSGYSGLVDKLITLLHTIGEYDSPDPTRITCIDHGDYQGTQLYIIGADGYQPSTYWSIFVSYGSCSGCDTYQAIMDYADITVDKANDLWTLMLHMVQSMKLVGKE